MPPISQWFSRILPSGHTRGLSGDLSALLSVDPSESWYNQRLSLHRTGQMGLDADLLWAGKPGRRACSGLQGHLAELASEGELGFTDLLLVLSAEDSEELEPGIAEALASRVREWLEREALKLPFPQRRAQVHLVTDGSDSMKGRVFGLQPGEFVTGAIPNLHRSRESSRPDLAVYLNLPDAWEGYREVGRLHADQLLFTLGSHWLDNACHAHLPGPAVYQLHKEPSGEFVQALNPDVEGSHVLEQEKGEEDSDIILLRRREDDKVVARLVLAVLAGTVDLLPQGGDLPPAIPPATDPKTPPEQAPLESSPLEPIAQPPHATATSSPTLAGHLTIVPEMLPDHFLTLQESGALLQKVHFPEVMTGYDVFISSSGHLVTQPGRSLATFQVRDKTVQFHVQGEGVWVDGEAQGPGVTLSLTGTHVIEAAGRRMTYVDLSQVSAKGWPYLGEIRREGPRTHLALGGTSSIGRGKSCRVRLPDQHLSENIRWRGEPRESVRARTGMVDRSRFYTDSIMVASEHAEVDLRGRPTVRCTARHCFTYIRRGELITPLHPTQRSPGPGEYQVQSGDEILVGNCLFTVLFRADLLPQDWDVSMLSDGMVTDVRGVMDVEDKLNAARSREASQKSAEPAETSPAETSPAQRSPTAVDVPAMSAHGEKGPAPVPIDFEVDPWDSILMEPGKASVGVSKPQEDSTASQASTEIGVVAWVEERHWQQALAQHARLIQVGWMVSGEQLLGNHRGVDLLIPELRINKNQSAPPREYLSLKVRGKRGTAELMCPAEAQLFEGETDCESCKDLDALRVEILRRDIDGEEDFRVELSIQADPTLPDPRARFLAIDLSDPMTAALFTQGVSADRPKAIELGPIAATARQQGEALVVGDYLETAQTDGGEWIPFFRAKAGAPFRTVTERGQPLRLRAGDRLIAGCNVYLVDLDEKS